MDITTQRRLLNATAGLLLVGAAGAVGWAISGTDSATPISSPAGNPIPLASEQQNQTQPFDDSLATRSLRGPLYEPPPPAPTPKPPPIVRRPPAPAERPKPTLNLTLVGTIIESTRSMAIVEDAAGNFDVKSIGEPLELSPAGVTIQSIEPEQVTLRFQGTESTFTLNRNKKSTGKGPGNVSRNNKRRRNP